VVGGSVIAEVTSTAPDHIAVISGPNLAPEIARDLDLDA